MRDVKIASFQLSTEAAERVSLDDMAFSDTLFARTKAPLFKKVYLSINSNVFPLVRQGSTLTTESTGKPLAVVAGNSSITLDMFANIEVDHTRTTS